MIYRYLDQRHFATRLARVRAAQATDANFRLIPEVGRYCTMHGSELRQKVRAAVGCCLGQADLRLLKRLPKTRFSVN
jgi:hypothetical protein